MNNPEFNLVSGPQIGDRGYDSESKNMDSSNLFSFDPTDSGACNDENGSFRNSMSSIFNHNDMVSHPNFGIIDPGNNLSDRSLSAAGHDNSSNFDFSIKLNPQEVGASNGRFSQNNSVFLESFISNFDNTESKDVNNQTVSESLKKNVESEYPPAVNMNDDYISKNVFEARRSDYFEKPTYNYNTENGEKIQDHSENSFSSNSRDNYLSNQSHNLLGPISTSVSVDNTYSNLYIDFNPHDKINFSRNNLNDQITSVIDNNSEHVHSNPNPSKLLTSNYKTEKLDGNNPVTPATILNLGKGSFNDSSLTSNGQLPNSTNSFKNGVPDLKLGNCSQFLFRNPVLFIFYLDNSANLGTKDNLDWLFYSSSNPGKNKAHNIAHNSQRFLESNGFNEFLKDSDIDQMNNSHTVFNSNIINHSAPPGQFAYFQQPPYMFIDSPALEIDAQKPYLNDGAKNQYRNNAFPSNLADNGSNIQNYKAGQTSTLMSQNAEFDSSVDNSVENSIKHSQSLIEIVNMTQNSFINLKDSTKDSNNKDKNVAAPLNSENMYGSVSEADGFDIISYSTSQSYSQKPPKKNTIKFDSSVNTKLKTPHDKSKSAHPMISNSTNPPSVDNKITDPSPRLLPKIFPRVHSRGKRSGNSISNNVAKSEKKLKKNPGIYSEILKPTPTSEFVNPFASGKLIVNSGDKFRNQVSNFNLGPSALIVPKTSNPNEKMQSSSAYSTTKTLNESDVDASMSPSINNDYIFSPIDHGANAVIPSTRDSGHSSINSSSGTIFNKNEATSLPSEDLNYSFKVNENKFSSNKIDSPDVSDYSADNIIEKLTNKSNYQNIVDGESERLGLSYPKEIYTKLISRRTVHKAAEQQRRDVQRCAFNKLKSVLPKISEDRKSTSKVSILNLAVKEIGTLKNTISEKDDQLSKLKEEIVELKKKIQNSNIDDP
ncbi:hypothetical protein AYI68_g4053 [Smittium mucronatum]|uniref:BHLH domain-containing protein n=1 Tax=Smittium mucronatum TaxID=133383 RepID=A0A1R0GY76_9FUNG|nr:hypothetical protein AYI68_g4053 [Smittium mucronatum]